MKPYNGGIRHDYKDIDARPARVSPRWSWFAFGLVVPLIGVALFLTSESNEARNEPPGAPNETAADATLSDASVSGASIADASAAATPMPAMSAAPEPGVEPAAAASSGSNGLPGMPEPQVFLPLDLPEPAPAPLPIDPAAAVLDLLVERGDTLEQLFRRNGLNLTDLAAMVAIPEAAGDLKRLKPGDRIQVAHREGSVLSLSREIDALDLLSIQRRDDGFAVSKAALPIERRTSIAHGVIRSSLFEAGMDAGISDAVTMRMAGIFEWDIDFLQDVRDGDAFTLIYEELWRDGVKIRDGEILAAEFMNQGKPHRAVRYTLGDGRADYFTPEGRSVRKAFIRAPVDFTRISSPFNPKRRHPILNTIRAHRGVDYAAPTGTPVRAAGDGKVIFRGSQGGYGNTIIVQHGGNVTTLYGHLSRFAKPRVGNRVRQGEVIGYVGKSGLATGPHLHYEYRVNGAHRNPRTVPLPAAEPVPAARQTDFLASTAELWRQLDLQQRTRIAAAE